MAGLRGNFAISVSGLLLISWLDICSAKKCAHFEFPNALGRNDVTIANDTTFTVPFQLNTSDCSSLGDFFITVSAKIPQTKIFTDFCKFPHKNRKCDSSALLPGCECPDDSGLYKFTRKTNQNVIFLWSTGSADFAKNAEIKVKVVVRDPANVTSLTFSGTGSEDLQSYSAAQGDKVDVICFFSEGNPPVQAHLLNRDRRVLKGEPQKGQIRYTFPAAGCEDAGLIRCEAPWATQNQTAILLVKCPPELKEIEPIAVKSDQEAELRFHVRTHTKDIKACQLEKLPGTEEHEKDVTHEMELPDKNCSNIVALEGTPPDMTLTVPLNNVRKVYEGQWRLKLTNDVGNGHVDFTLKFLAVDVTATTVADGDTFSVKHPEDNGASTSGVDVTKISGIVLGVNIGTIIIIIIVVLIIGTSRDLGYNGSLQPQRKCKWRQLSCKPGMTGNPALRTEKPYQGE